MKVGPQKSSKKSSTSRSSAKHVVRKSTRSHASSARSKRKAAPKRDSFDVIDFLRGWFT